MKFNKHKITKYILGTNYSLSAYCRKIKINKATLSRYMSEERVPSFEMAKKIVHESKGFIRYKDIYGKDKYLN